MYIYPRLRIVCEGEVDKIILAHLAQRLLVESSIQREVEIIPANGKAVIPRMVHAIEARLGPQSTLIVVDSDGNEARTWATLRTKLPWEKYSLVIAHPDVESWVFPESQAHKHAVSAAAAQMAQTINLRTLESLHPEFAKFRIAVTTLKAS
jgi:Overcoming lysogenization defect protein-like, TOPRIM domain